MLGSLLFLALDPAHFHPLNLNTCFLTLYSITLLVKRHGDSRRLQDKKEALLPDPA